MEIFPLFRNEVVNLRIEFIFFRCVPGGFGYRSSHILRVTNLTPDLTIGSNNT